MTAIGWLRLNSDDADDVLVTVSRDEALAPGMANVILVIDGHTFELTSNHAQALAGYLAHAAWPR